VQTIHEQFMNKAPMDVVLKLGDDVPVKEATLTQLNHFGDNVIIFRAIDATSPELRAHLHRAPLAPMNTQVTVKPLQNTTLNEKPANIIQGSINSKNGSKQPHTFASGFEGYGVLVPHPGHLNTGEAPQDENRLPSQVHNATRGPSHGQDKWIAYKPDTPSVSSYTPYYPSLQDTAKTSTEKVDRGPIESERHKRVESLMRYLSHEPPPSPAISPLEHREPVDGVQLVQYSCPPAQAADATSSFAHIEDDCKQEAGKPEPIVAAPTNPNLQTLTTEKRPEILEEGVAKGLELLEALRVPLLAESGNKDAEQWLHQIDNLRKQATRTRTVVGVVGNTGAGKSSVINAMLDEERLVPTNCMRACTAVVTELSWNDSEEEDSKYRAEIEFIQPEDWARELKVLFEELIDSNGNVSRECSNADSEAGVAYAKIKAVYPKMTKEMLASSSIEKMMSDTAVQKLLGTVRSIKEKEADVFYKKLQHYVDSKEKATGEKGKDKKVVRKEMEFWPLIKVVKIYTKSDALSTGAVVVDLPGVHDSNAARAAVAEGYMKQCTGLWIVAPITRAVDDKAAKSLLGESFRRQLKFDGTYSHVTFICSKTDDISITEAVDTLGLEEDLAGYFEEIDRIDEEKSQLEDQWKELRESKAVYEATIEDLSDKFEDWELLRDEAKDGKVVYEPKADGKRKRSSSDSPQKEHKKRRTSKSSGGSDSGTASDTDETESEPEGEDAASDEEEDRQPLSIETITEKIEEFRQTKERGSSPEN
jgi:hypothetical protein